MFVKNFNFNSALNTIITLALGFITAVFFIVMLMEFVDYRDNVSKINSLDVVDTGRVHIFAGMDYTNSSMEYRKCVVLERNGRVSWEDVTPNPRTASTLCEGIASKAKSWQANTYAPGASGGDAFLTVAVLIPFVLSAWFVLFVLVIFFAIVTRWEWLGTNALKVSGILAIPLLVFGLFYLGGSHMSTNTVWQYKNHVVDTSEVYITRDGSLHRKASTLAEWTDTNIGSKITQFGSK